MVEPLTSDSRNLPMLIAYCDFGHCSASCWRRCAIPNGCWDGRPTNLYREAWKVRGRVTKVNRRRPRARKWLEQPVQYALELEPREAA